MIRAIQERLQRHRPSAHPDQVGGPPMEEWPPIADLYQDLSRRNIRWLYGPICEVGLPLFRLTPENQVWCLVPVHIPPGEGRVERFTLALGVGPHHPTTIHFEELSGFLTGQEQAQAIGDLLNTCQDNGFTIPQAMVPL